MIRWTPERCEMLRSSWAAGVSAELIAERFSRLWGEEMSRSVILGKVKRMELPARPTSKKKAYPTTQLAPPPQVKSQSTPIILAPHSAFDPDPIILLSSVWEPLPGCRPASIIELTPHTCRWPVTGGFCGRGKGHGPYCDHHENRAKIKQQPKPVETKNDGYSRRADLARGRSRTVFGS